jgi:hypothetical protein
MNIPPIESPPKCACGCDCPVSRSKLPPHGWNRFVTGHNRRLEMAELRAAGLLNPARKDYPERPCEECGDTFKPWRVDKRFCSVPCQIKRSSRLRYLRLHGQLPDTERHCGICDAVFPRVDRYDWRRQYCSDACSKEAVRRSRKRFHERNPTARRDYRPNEDPRWSSTTGRFFLRYPDVERKCMVCGEDRVVDIHHKIARNGAPTRAKNTTRENVWILCPNHHTMIHRGVATPEQMGLA